MIQDFPDFQLNLRFQLHQRHHCYLDFLRFREHPDFRLNL
jgi:hypothetical protein